MSKLPRGARTGFLILLGLSMLVSLGYGISVTRRTPDRDTLLGFGVLPATQSLMNGNGLTICSADLTRTTDNPICYHSSRMPMAEWVMALGMTIFGDHMLWIAIFKIVLLLIPLELAAFIVWLNFAGTDRHRIFTFLLLLVPFAINAFLLDVISLDFEEAYAYGLIALAFSIALFWNRKNLRRGFAAAAIIGLTIGAIYLCKSSLLPVAAILLFACLGTLQSRHAKLLALMLALAAPAGWLAYQHHAGGRYTLGTSLDGFNLHMGNSPNFLRDYKSHRSLDETADQLNIGHHFSNEWELNDYHQKAAIAFIKANPSQGLHGELRKLKILFFSIATIGVWSHHGIMLLIDTGGMILFRLMFWTALIVSLWGALKNYAGLRRAGLTYLLFVAAAMLPYMLGFGYTRHVSILIYPTAIFCCYALQNAPGLRHEVLNADNDIDDQH